MAPSSTGRNVLSTDRRRAPETASVLNVRTGPGTSNRITGTCISGEVFVASELRDGWLHIWHRGAQYWISAQYTSIVRF